MGKSPKYTRRHYMEIGNLIKELPEEIKERELEKWDTIFKKDNERYNSERFRAYVHEEGWKKNTFKVKSIKDGEDD